MITVPYTEVLRLAVEMSSRTYPPTTEQAAVFKTFIQHHLRLAWEAYAWPELCQVQEERFAPVWGSQIVYNRGDVVYYAPQKKYYQMIRAGVVISIIGNTPLEPAYWAEASSIPFAENGEWDSTTTYFLGNRVTFQSKVYQCVVDAPVGTLPIDLAYWGEVPPWFRFISKTLDAAGEPRDVVIGEFFGITQEDPRAYAQTTGVGFFTTFQGSVGANIYDAFQSVWINFRRSPPTVIADTDSIPARFSQIVALQAAASMLRTDGKSDQADEFLLMANAALQSELEKAVTQEQQSFRTDVIGR